jgi:ferredoxin
MKIRVERSLCISSGTCVNIAPEVFEMDQEDIACVKNPAGSDEQTIMEAAETCPVSAIIIEDDDGNQIYP